MSKRLGSRALLSSFAAVAVIAGIGGVFDAAHAATIQVQCAAQGTEVGNTDPSTGLIAASPITIQFAPSHSQLFQYGQHYANAPGIPPQPTFSNTLFLVSNTASAPILPLCNSSLSLHLTGLNPSAYKVVANIQTNYGTHTDNYSSTAIVTNGTLVNGTADLSLPIDGIAEAASLAVSQTDAVSVTIYNDINQVLLPETVKLTAAVTGSNFNNHSTNSYDLVKDKTFFTLSANGSLLFVPSAYIPSTLMGSPNAIVASYYTITAPPGIGAGDIDVYILNATNSGNGTNIRYCGNASGLSMSSATSSTNTSQNINQIVLDLSQLVKVCNVAGAGLSNPNQLQSGIPILFVVKADNGANAYSPLNITADGYSLFNYNGQVYIKRLATEVISGNPSVGTTGGSEASYAH